MALLNSEPLNLASPLPAFHLKDAVSGQNFDLNSFSDKKVLVILFICAHCPYVQAVEDRLVELRKDYEGRGVQLIGICSNDASAYPDDSPENLRTRALDYNYGFPYLIDETQEIAKNFGAVCTPDIFVYGRDRKLAYHGRIDDNWKDATQAKRHELREALDDLLSGHTPLAQQMPSMGCSIKWKT
ncbi:MAG: thioredoxin family protein [Deltaproteobacteria bacterium]|nr:thioredoxin family protein [Deltaproteobacteria bacterium]